MNKVVSSVKTFVLNKYFALSAFLFMGATSASAQTTAGIDALATNASSTLSAIIGFSIGEFINKGVEFLKLTAGTVLAYFQATYPVLLTVAGLYLIYKLARWGWARYS